MPGNVLAGKCRNRKDTITPFNMTSSIEIAWVISFVVALLTTSLIHPVVVYVARKKRVYDNPNERKLQRNPVPLLGGVAVFIGMLAGLVTAHFLVGVGEYVPEFIAMVIMLAVGTLDDVKGLSPYLRFVVEIAIVVLLMFMTGISLNDFQGLWGVGEIPSYISVPLTIFAVVGIINAINLIDGVDGLSSGFCIMASLLFGALFYTVGDSAMTAVALVSVGALLPFFFHNVFGKNSKMFIGDGGTLMMGVIIASYVVHIISAGSKCEVLIAKGFGVIPFSLAVLAVPVFDTLRVMTARIMRHTSPFYPDKTHLHHLFIELGYSHAGVTVSVLSLNGLVVVAWWLSYYLGASIDVQLYVVLAFSLLITFVFYKFMRGQIARHTAIYRAMNKIGESTRIERRGIWLSMQHLVDWEFTKEQK